jgi:DNA polymerase-3 subunit delta
LAASPVVYLLDGEDEFGIAEFLSKLQAKLGDPTTADMDTTRLDGHLSSLNELTGAVLAMPFLASRRLVILTHPTHRLTSPALRKKFTHLIDELPPATALVLVSDHLLTDDRNRKRGEVHWLEKYILSIGERAYIKHFPLPTGEAMVKWIQERAKAAGGQLTPQAATSLATLVGEDPRLADQEIHKLLAYVNYARPVEPDDVEHLTPTSARLKDFALVNALRSRDKRQAQAILHRMLEDDDPILILHNIVAQYRLLLIAREALDHGQREDEIARQLKMHPYPVRLAMDQARHFSLQALESIYHHLLDVDEAIKTGQMPGELALDRLIVELSL